MSPGSRYHQQCPDLHVRDLTTEFHCLEDVLPPKYSKFSINFKPAGWRFWSIWCLNGNHNIFRVFYRSTKKFQRSSWKLSESQYQRPQSRYVWYVLCVPLCMGCSVTVHSLKIWSAQDQLPEVICCSWGTRRSSDVANPIQCKYVE